MTRHASTYAADPRPHQPQPDVAGEMPYLGDGTYAAAHAAACRDATLLLLWQRSLPPGQREHAEPLRA